MMDIIKYRKHFFCFSVLVMLVGIIILGFNVATHKGAFNYDIQFTGGTSITADIGKDFNNDDVAAVVKEATGEESPQIQKVLNSNSVIVKTKLLDLDKRKALTDAICAKYSLTMADLQVSDVSATISSEMQRLAILSIVVACIAMLLYVTFRFRDLKKGTSAILALVHDAVVVVLFYAVFRIPLDNSFIAVVLTVLGFSINSTIIVFDRIRENSNKISVNKLDELINSSVNQTLTRSIYTTLTVLITTVCLYVFGVQSVKYFSLPLIVGIAFGGYSSICLSGSLWYTFKHKSKN